MFGSFKLLSDDSYLANLSVFFNFFSVPYFLVHDFMNLSFAEE